MKKFWIVALALFVSACAYKAQPIHNVVDRPMPVGSRPLTMAEIENAIINAGQSLDWRFEKLGEGRLRATQDQAKHAATAEIVFDQKKYSITQISSRNLNQQGDRIHSRYNVWARNLEKSINTMLAMATQRQ